MAQVTLDEPGIDAGFEARGGVRMPEGRDGHAHVGHAGTVFGGTAGALDTGATPRGGRCWTVLLLAPSGGKEPGLVPVGFPGGAEQREGLCGQRDGPVFGPLATMDLDLEALAIDVGDLQGEGFLESESQARDGGKGDLVVHGRGGRAEPPDLLHTEDGWETVCGWRAHAREGMPVALEDVVREEAAATGAEAQGSWGEAVDVFAVQEGALQRLFGEQVGRCVIELSQQAYCADRGFLSPFAFATEVESCNHVLTQWGHEMSPFLR
jgi:hypothetical protein